MNEENKVSCKEDYHKQRYSEVLTEISQVVILYKSVRFFQIMKMGKEYFLTSTGLQIS